MRIVVQGTVCGSSISPPSHDYFFSIRDPIGRFVSGFYSRKRKGQPRIYVEWTEDEAAAFARFDHANDLAEALFQPGPDGQAAFAAIKSIFHTAMDQVSWFERRGQFLEVRPPIAILRQESLTRDLTAFLDVIGCADMPIEVSRDPVSAHSNTYEGIPRLSDRAKDNLRRWYAQDYELYARCCEWIEMRQGG
ncbi:MAG: hypothetical protein R3B82_15535 [Sandaracinaceae bacterium]